MSGGIMLESSSEVAVPVSRRPVVAILVASPLTEDIYRRIGADEMAAEFDVLVVDCLAWVRRFAEGLSFARKQAGNIIDVASEAELQQVLRQYAPAFVVDFVGRGPFTRTIQEVCRSAGAKYVTHHLVPFPASVSSHDLWRSLLRHPWRTVVKMQGYLRRRLKRSDPHPPDIALIAGRRSEAPWLMSAKAVVRTATPGFFELANVKALVQSGALSLPADLQGQKYLLFIDDCLALSFDFALGDFSPIVSAEQYYQILNAFFDQVEKTTGLPVVIAAHPNGKEYPHYADLFGGRRLHHESTALLALGCVCAFTHFSSAINYPVLLRKPIAILTFDKLRAAMQGEVAAMIASLLQRPLLDMSAEHPSGEALNAGMMVPPNEAAYAAYERAYIVDTESPGRHPFDNLMSHLKDMLSASAEAVKH